MKVEFNVDRATFILGVCGTVVIAITVSDNPWWLFGLLFMLMWAVFSPTNKDAKDGEKGKGSSDG